MGHEGIERLWLGTLRYYVCGYRKAMAWDTRVVRVCL